MSQNPHSFSEHSGYNPIPMPHPVYNPMPIAQAVGAENPQSELHKRGAELMGVWSKPKKVAFDTRMGNMQADCVICMVITFVFIFLVFHLFVLTVVCPQRCRQGKLRLD